jgi:PAS domain S-box-containing protein
MSKDRQQRHAAKDAAAHRERAAGGDCPVIVVGIGASAGALNSLKQLFAKMPAGRRIALVLVQHPEPSHENLTVEQLRNLTDLEAVDATDGMPVLADRIHVMPPDKFLSINGAILNLQEPVECNGLLMPIDHFFCALAVDQRGRGCGIILSGIGSDGTLGLSEIRATGGRTLVEAPGSAEFPEMPQRAIDAGVADAVLRADAMAEAIVALAEQVKADTRNAPAESPEFDADLRAIVEILRLKVGHDFRCYKPNTLVRRIRRRMTLAKVDTYADYARFLTEHSDEVGVLQKDLLIGVTEFFRQPSAWKILREKVIAPLVEATPPRSNIRAWVPGCATGKEVYSLAMLLAEQIEASGRKADVQIFATDADASALAIARSGNYSEEEIGENISPRRLKQFFARKDGHYQIIKEIREKIVFAPQNLTADPPFSRLDLISCRNLLIYLEQRVQQKIIALFHFALSEGGFLFLGTAETVGDREDLFEPVSKKWRIYRRIGVGRRVPVEIPLYPTGGTAQAAGRLPLAAAGSRMSLASAAQQMLLDRFAPACVIIDRRFQVLYVHGAVADYLTFPPGELTTRVVDMAREGLRARLRGAISQCVEAGGPVSVTARVRRAEKSVPVRATVTPLRYPRETDGLLLIAFEDYRLRSAKSRRQTAGESDVRQLEDELKVTREELQSTIDQLEISNDQLKASNEEVTAANEELQSANEELETSKEELQSLNEELNTINARLQEKVEELEGANNDVVNLLSSTNIATVFLDKQLKVKRYTPAITRLFSLIPSDAGRPLADVRRRFTDVSLLEEAARVLADLTPISKEVQAEGGRWFIRRITPYRTQDDRIEGVVVTFVDVCNLKETEQALRESQHDLNRAQAVAHTGSWRLDVRRDALRWSEEAYRIFGIPKGTPLTYEAFLAAVHPDDRAYVGEKWAAALRGEPYDIEHRIVVGETVKWVRERAELEFEQQGGPIGGFGTVQDITERKRTAELIESAALFPEENPFPTLRAAEDGTVLYANRPAAALLEDWQCRVGSPVPEFAQKVLATALASGRNEELEVRCGERDLWLVVVPIVERGYVNFYGHDVTDRNKAEKALRESENKLRIVTDFTYDWESWNSSDGRFLYVSPSCERITGYTREEFMRNPDLYTRLVHPDDRERFSAHLSEEQLDQKPCEIEFRIVGRDGRQRWIAHACQSVLGEHGAPLGRRWSNRDITERKQMEEDLRKTRDELELRVQERTAELEKMYDEQKIYTDLLERSNRDLEDFAHVASHDLQEPLRKIQIFADRLVMVNPDALNQEARECVERMQRAAGRMRALVSDLVQYARVTSTKESFKRFNLKEPVDEAVMDLDVLREEMEGRVEVGELPDIEGDPVQMRQLFQNLIGNGLKYRGEREPRIRVYAHSSGPGPFWEIFVKDNGIGFDERYLDKIFKPFQRLHGKNAPYEGTGMGLAICRRIVERHGGSISAKSEPGNGATFVVRLPKKQARRRRNNENRRHTGCADGR